MQMPSPELTLADLMRILDEALHEALVGEPLNSPAPTIPGTHPHDLPRFDNEPVSAIEETQRNRAATSTDTQQIRAAVATSPQPEKLTRREYDLLDDY